ncbi:ATP-dependent helicase [Candidatus Saccharibacteria bacterium]|nr:ATP-dependent helicase [Candidatus Saccharibacteria bacterium]
MPLNAKQKEAVETIQGPLLVLAGPGTGKTHLLSSRVEYILKNTDTNPENILCVTFTENGASNMRERLLSVVGAAARKIEIHTYHAFGVDLLNTYKNYAETFDRNLDAQIDEVQQYKIVKEIQESLPGTDILRKATTADIVSTIGSAKSARLTGDDLIKVAEANIKLSEKLVKEISPILERAKRGARFFEAVEATYTPILEILAGFTSPEPIVGEVEPIANVLARDLKRIIDGEMGAEKPSAKPLSDWRNSNFEKDDEGHFRLKDRIKNKKLKSLGNIFNLYTERLEKEGLYDFSDMIEQAIEILRKDKGFRLTEQERFQYILLDEFQDTNPSQFELIKLLTDYDEPNVMAVGDDDQAIFEFQGADASNLLTFQQHYGAKVINLEENYRSNQEILDLSRRIAGQINDSFAKKQHVAKTLKAFKGEGAEIARHEFLTSDGEYAWVAQEIEKLIKAGVPQKEIAIITRKHKYIAPLLPFLKESGKINIAYEKRENVLEDPRLAEILTLAKFIDDLARGRNVSSRLLEILAFPFWGVPAAEAVSCIYRAKEDKKRGLDYLLKADSPKLRELGEFLATLAVKSFDTPLELMLDYLVGTVAVRLPSEMPTESGESGEVSKEGALLRGRREFRSPFIEYYDAEQGEYETFELYENLAVLKEAILSHTKEKNLRLKDLVMLVEDYQDAKKELTNTSPYRDSADAVQIVTAHKSKGLEYEYVFVVAADNMAWGGSKGNNDMLFLPKNMVQIRHTMATDDERLRLFFVALTRAKRVLMISNSLKDFAGKSPKRLDYLAEYEDGEGNVISPYITPDGKYKVKQHYEDLSEIRKTVDLRKTWRSAYAKLTPELRPILTARMENYKLTASDLTSFIDISYGGPMSFYANKVLRAPQEPATENVVFGTLVHATFERITREKISDEEAVAFYRGEAEKADLTEKDVKYLLEKGEQALKISLAQFGSLLRAENSRAEVNLYSEHIEIGDIPATGKLDHIEIDEKAKTIEIYDFKTGKYHKEKWGSVDSLYKYSLQLGFYKLLLNNSPTYRKYAVTRGHILFVNPDEEGKVYDKVLEFDNPKEYDEAKLIDIAGAVYRQAKSLAFLDDEELRVEADKNKGLKEVKEFIELLLAKTAQKQ